MASRADVAIAGGGPAGAVAALALARLGVDVALVEAGAYEQPRPGEALPPAAAAVLARLGLDGVLEAAGATPSFGNRSAWGGDEVETGSFVFDPYGPGWHVDRRRLDALLAREAAAAGAVLLARTRVTGCAPAGEGTWRLALAGAAAGDLGAREVVDATGRGSHLARRLGARRRVTDRLVGVAVTYGGAPQGGGTLVEAVPAGWWYSAPVPPRGLVAVLMTDADLCRGAGWTRPAGWAAALAGAPHTRDRVGALAALSRPRVASAASHRLGRPPPGARWLAVGDAAMAADPLSGTGVLRALLTGEAAAAALAHRLAGRPGPAGEYEDWLDERFDAYEAERRTEYGVERRWPEAPFWRRRAAPATL